MADPTHNPAPPTPRIQLYAKNIRRNVKILNARPIGVRDIYYFLVSAGWFRVIVALASLYVVGNLFFGWLFYLSGGISNARPDSYWDHFFFSVQTMGTIGYGVMAPASTIAHVLVTIESVVGLLLTALATGLVFAKFSRPQARVLFSNAAVINVRDGVPTLMFRVANERANHVVEAQMRVALARNEMTKEGEQIRKVHDLHLLRSQTPAFIFTWLVLHPITEHSPLFGATPELLQQWSAEIMVNLVGMDEILTQTIHSRHSYTPENIRFNHRFKDILSTNEQGQRQLDYALFHESEPIQAA